MAFGFQTGRRVDQAQVDALQNDGKIVIQRCVDCQDVGATAPPDVPQLSQP